MRRSGFNDWFVVDVTDTLDAIGGYSKSRRNVHSPQDVLLRCISCGVSRDRKDLRTVGVTLALLQDNMLLLLHQLDPLVVLPRHQ